MAFEDAENLFRQSCLKENCPASADLLLLTLLNRSDYRRIAKSLGPDGMPAGELSLYTRYWFAFMTGQLDELPGILDAMIASRNLFLRAFALKENLKSGRLTPGQAPASVERHLHSAGLSYELSLEEERFTLYRHILRNERDDARRKADDLLTRFSRFPELYLDALDTAVLTLDQARVEAILKDPAFRKTAECDMRLRWMMAREWARAGDLVKSGEFLAPLTEVFRNNPLFHYNLASAFMSRKKYLKAMNHYEQAVLLAPLFERAHYNLGVCYFRLGSVDRAADSFRKCLSFGRSQDALYNLTVCQIERKELRDAYFCLSRFPSGSSPYPVGDIKSRIKKVVLSA